MNNSRAWGFYHPLYGYYTEPRWEPAPCYCACLKRRQYNRRHIPLADARPSLPEFHGKYLSLNYPCRQTNLQVISADLRRFPHWPHAALQFRDFFRADY